MGSIDYSMAWDDVTQAPSTPVPFPQVHKVEGPDGTSLALDWYPAGPGAQVALFVHGFGSHRRGEKAVHFAESFNERGWAFAAFDMRGHGESGGTLRDLTMTGMLSDLTAAAGWIAETTGSSSAVLIGSSMGSAVIAWYALTLADRVGPLVMIAPALRFPADLVAELGPESLDRWRRTGLQRFKNAWIDLEIGYGLLEEGVRYDPERLLRRHV